MKTVVITGSSRGIGLGMADAFLARDCAVVLSGRTGKTTELALAKLAAVYSKERILSQACDVRSVDQVQELWKRAVQRFGKVDIWVNNAGLSGPMKKLWEYSPDVPEIVLGTNLLGVIYGSQVACRGMINQMFGSIYNVEGMGSDGRMHDGLALYGMTKYGLKYFTDALVEETKGTAIIVGALRPGMVATDLITNQYQDKPVEWQRVKKIFNLIAERVEVVAPWLVDRMLANQKTGVRFNYSSPWKILLRFMSSPFSKRDVFSGH